MLSGWCDSLVVATDVHHPTDGNLLWDARRCLIRESGRAARECDLRGWRQKGTWTDTVRERFHAVGKSRQATPQRVKAYRSLCRPLVVRAEARLTAWQEAQTRSLSGTGSPDLSADAMGEATKWMDPVECRLLKGETIPHAAKVVSLCERHTRWLSKGKAGVPVKRGVPVCIVADECGFILHHRILWNGRDGDPAVPMIAETQSVYPSFRSFRFERGFHSPLTGFAWTSC